MNFNDPTCFFLVFMTAYDFKKLIKQHLAILVV